MFPDIIKRGANTNTNYSDAADAIMDYSQQCVKPPDLLAPLLLLAILFIFTRVDITITSGSKKYSLFSWLIRLLRKRNNKTNDKGDTVRARRNRKGRRRVVEVVESKESYDTDDDYSNDNDPLTKSERRIVEYLEAKRQRKIAKKLKQKGSFTWVQSLSSRSLSTTRTTNNNNKNISGGGGNRRLKLLSSSSANNASSTRALGGKKRFNKKKKTLSIPLTHEEIIAQAMSNASTLGGGRKKRKFQKKKALSEPPRSKPIILLQGEMSSSSTSTTMNIIHHHNQQQQQHPQQQLPLPLCRYDSCRTSTTSQSMESHLSTMLDKYAFMSYRFPITTETKKVFFRKQPKNKDKNNKDNNNPTSDNNNNKQQHHNDVLIETSGGNCIGSIEHMSCSTLLERWGDVNGGDGNGDVRILKDATGRHCAIIHKTQEDAFLGGPMVFRVYGDKPSVFGQEPSLKEVVNGCYLWAEIRNEGSVMGGKFVMKRYTSEKETASYEDYDRHYAKPFGSFLSKSKGYTIMDSEEKQCVKMVSLEKNRNKGIVIAPKRDMCLMLAYCAVVDEMVENMLI